MTTIRLPGAYSPFIAECLAAREGAQLATQCSFQTWMLESDATNVVLVVQSLTARSLESHVFDDIRDIMPCNGSGTICYVPPPREHNSSLSS